jgi:hypothetical protein
VVCPLDSTYPRHRLPKYWSAQYLAAYQNFVNALAAHIDSTPALANNIDWIELPIGVYGELNPGASQDRACLQELGLTQDLWETTVQQMIDIWTDAFAYTSIDLSFQGTNYYLDKGNRQRMNDYAADQGVGLQHAKWHPDWEDMAIACTACWSRGKGMVDAPLRWENRVMVAIEYPDPPCRAQVVARRSTTPRRITGTWQPSSISRETFTRRASTHADVGAADHREPLRAGHDPNRA